MLKTLAREKKKRGSRGNLGGAWMQCIIWGQGWA
jgi:hypothetical protein